jgi:DNA-binding CsgD family transcriptional regulator
MTCTACGATCRHSDRFCARCGAALVVGRGTQHDARNMMKETCACRLRTLTARELDIAELLAQGLSTETAAGVLSLSHHTITAHLGNMLRNLNVRNRTELVALLYSYGVFVSGEWPPRATRRRDIPTCQCSRTREQPNAAPQVVAHR